jgi:hypothetical protein
MKKLTVTTQLLLIKAPPHISLKYTLFVMTWTCHGNSPNSANSPPAIREFLPWQTATTAAKRIKNFHTMLFGSQLGFKCEREIEGNKVSQPYGILRVTPLPYQRAIKEEEGNIERLIRLIVIYFGY